MSGGVHRGRPLPRPVADGVRPTSSRVREALFSIVGQDLAGRRVLDAFGGTGLLGFEAWSRGASVVVVERDARTAATIRANAAALRSDVDVRVGDVLALARTGALGRFEIVLADPPYRDAPEPVVAALGPLADEALVLEIAAETAAPEPPPGMVLERRREYGGTALVVYGPGQSRSEGRSGPGAG